MHSICFFFFSLILRRNRFPRYGAARTKDQGQWTKDPQGLEDGVWMVFLYGRGRLLTSMPYHGCLPSSGSFENTLEVVVSGKSFGVEVEAGGGGLGGLVLKTKPRPRSFNVPTVGYCFKWEVCEDITGRWLVAQDLPFLTYFVLACPDALLVYDVLRTLPANPLLWKCNSRRYVCTNTGPGSDTFN